ncbi:unnamed protein product, partial [Mesorhabditis spiculigera]
MVRWYERIAVWLNAGARRLCALPQLGSWLYAVNSPSPPIPRSALTPGRKVLREPGLVGQFCHHVRARGEDEAISRTFLLEDRAEFAPDAHGVLQRRPDIDPEDVPEDWQAPCRDAESGASVVASGVVSTLMVCPRQRRTQLLDIGAQLFADRSYEDVWIEEVAEIAGVSRGLMYHYFPTKRDFFAAIVERESQHLLEVTAPDATLPVREQVAAGLDAYFAYVKSHSRGQQIRILDALEFEGERRQLAAVAVRGWIAFVRAVCLDWLDQPSIPQEELRVICLRTLSGALGIDLET